MKNNAFLNFILNFLQLFMQLCVAVVATNFILHGFMHYETFHAYNTFYIGIVVIVYYFTKCFINNGKLAFIIHLLAAISVLFVVNGAVEDKILVFLPAIILMSYSMKRKSEAPFILLDMGILVVSYVVGFSINSESATVIPFFATLIYIVAYMLWYNITNLNKMVSENGAVKSFNAEQSISVNSVMMAIFIVVCIIVMIISPYLRLEGIMWGFLNALWKLVILFFGMFKFDISDDSKKLAERLEENKNVALHSEPKIGIEMEMTQGMIILNVIAGIFAAFICVFLIVMLVKAIRNFKYYKSTGNDVKEFIKPLARGDRVDGTRKIAGFTRANTNKDKVRLIYYKLIKSKNKKTKNILGLDTPVQMSQKYIGWDDNSKIITDTYEKARYSNYEIKSNDVDIIKNATKNVKNSK